MQLTTLFLTNKTFYLFKKAVIYCTAFFLFVSCKGFAQNLNYRAPFVKDSLSLTGKYAYSLGLYSSAAFASHAYIFISQRDRLSVRESVTYAEFKKAFSQGPKWDNDHWSFNFLVHPVMGYISHTAYRNRGGTFLGAFLCNTACSAYYEFLVGSWTQRPSYNDLIITPIGGAIVGESVWQIRKTLVRDNYLSTFEKVVLTAIDPIEVLNQKFAYRNFIKKQPVMP